jgi:hypothetical protein
MADLLKIALRLYFTPKVNKLLCVHLRKRLMFQENKNYLAKSIKKENSKGRGNNGIPMAISLLVLKSLEKGKMVYYINFKRMVHMINTK